MKKVLRAAVFAGAFYGAAVGQAAAQPAPDLTGWWRAEVSHNGESRDFYIRFLKRGDKQGATFTIPAIGAADSPLGWVEVDGATVKLPNFGWALQLSDDGSTLSGILPDSLVPVYKLEARFKRAAPPEAPPAPAGYKPAPAPLWRQTLDGPVYGDLVHDDRDGLLFAATDAGTVFALKSATGKILWSTPVGSPVRAAPVLQGGALYVAGDAQLVKLDARSGRRLWAAGLGQPRVKRLEINDPNSRWDHYGSAPVVRNGSAYVGSRDGCLYAFKAANGSLERKVCTGDAITATPVITASHAYLGSFDGNVYAVRLADGSIDWKRDMRGPIARDLAISGNTILAGSRSYDLSAFGRDKGDLVWSRYIWYSWIDSPPIVKGDTVFIGSSDSQRVYAFDAASGRSRWETRIPGWAWARPEASGATVYAGAVGTNMKYVGRRDAAFAAIDRSDGRLRWLFQPPHDASAPIYGFAAAATARKGKVFAADLAGVVYAFKDE